MTAATLTIDWTPLTATGAPLMQPLARGLQTGAVIKAGAYGLGAARVAQWRCRAGVGRRPSGFFVAVHQKTAAELREAAGTGPK